MNILLTGGAGFVGSHVARNITAAGHLPIIYDDLRTGHAESVPDYELIKADLADGDALREAMTDCGVELVMHLAASTEAGESVKNPELYFRNNCLNGKTLLDAMLECGVHDIVFSSTAAVYGTPKRIPVKESDPLEPINPYGMSKLSFEYMLQAYAEAYGMGAVSLRYFNVAGADPSGDIGEDHRPETHLIPLVLQVPLGKKEEVLIFGDEHGPPDGTCIRDYVHVCDIAEAHSLATNRIERGRMKAYNLGNGDGFSVMEVVDACREVTGHDIPAEVSVSRRGDPAILVASSDKAMEELGWQPRHNSLKRMVEDAWRWHSSHPEGYG